MGSLLDLAGKVCRLLNLFIRDSRFLGFSVVVLEARDTVSRCSGSKTNENLYSLFHGLILLDLRFYSLDENAQEKVTRFRDAASDQKTAYQVNRKQRRTYQVPGRVSFPLERGQRSLIWRILPERIEKFNPRAVSQFARGARNILPKMVRGAAQYFLAQRKPSSSSSGVIWMGLNNTWDPS